MSTIAQQESLVKESLFQFVTKNIPSADLNLIDEIVLSYVISILEEASQDPCFDVEGFVEMMCAYFPEFSGIETALVCSWIFELEAELSQRSTESSDSTDGNDSAGSDKISLTLQSLTEMLPSVTKGSRSHSNSESSDSASKRCSKHAWDSCSECSSTDSSTACVTDVSLQAEQCQILHEMFPNSCAMEIKHCISIARGDIERAAQTLLHRRENGQSLMSGSTLAGLAKQRQIDDAELKNRIIARYSYVDKNSENKEHKPLAPKIEPKKLVRYRDNKIVSLKGERYTEIPKSGADEDQLKKPKKQHCP